MQKFNFTRQTIKFSVPAFIAAVVVSCTGSDRVVSQTTTPAPVPVSVSPYSEIIFDVLTAELAGRRGMLDVAADNYLSAANKTSDARVAERATKLAVFGRDWNQSEIAGKRWVALDPEKLEARQLLAQIQLTLGKVSGVTESLVGLIEFSKNNESGMHIAVSTLLADTNTRVASDVVNKLQALYPESHLIHYASAHQLFSQSHHDTAMVAVDKSLELNNEYPDAHLLKARILVNTSRATEGYSYLRKQISKNPKVAQLRLDLARLLVEKKQYDEASLEFDKIAELAPDDADTLYALSLLAIESRRTEQAETYLQNVLELGRHENESHYFLGRILENKQDFESALAHYEQVQTGENVLDAQIRASQIYGAIGQFRKGRERLQRLRMLTKDASTQIRITLTEGRMLRDKGDYEESLKVFEDGLELYPNNVEILYAHALSAEQLNQDDKFEENLRAVIKIDPNNAHALNALGYFLVDRGKRLSEAEKYLKKAISLIPEDPAITDSLGWLRYRQGDYAQAIALLKKAFNVIADPEIAAHLGEVLWVTGDQKSATDVWNKGLQYKSKSHNDVLKNVMDRYIQ